ncbi:MAG TPA: porin [Burkholderiales bacterium]|nr:porin [Burkholderiales bacterium]
MRRTALAVAVSGAFIAPAAHAQIVFGNEQLGTMQIYGRLYPELMWSKTSGATGVCTGCVSTMAATTGNNTTAGVDNGTHFGVQTSNSRLGFRGERRVLGGMKAIWQIEQTINFEDPDDVANNCNTPPLSAGGNADCTANGGVSSTDVVFATRNSFVGLNGGFGTVKLGNMDTVYKEYGDTLNMFGVKSGNFTSASNMLSHIGIGTNGLARFHERAPNSIMYETPTIAGITAGAMYMPDERHGDPAVTQNKRLWSVGVKYDSKMFYVSLAHEIHKDFFGLSRNVTNSLRNFFRNDGTGDDPHASSKDTATRLSGTIRLGDHEITGDVARLKWSENASIPLTAARIQEYKHTNWAIGWEGRFPGGFRGAAQYVRGGQGSCSFQGPTTLSCTTTGLASHMISLGAAYTLDRQTLLFALANWTKNGESARYDSSSLLSPARGADIASFGLGISYSF